MKEKNLPKKQPLPKVLRMRAIKDQSNYVTCISATYTRSDRPLSGVGMAPLRMPPREMRARG
jgi:hypothetical protein